MAEDLSVNAVTEDLSVNAVTEDLSVNAVTEDLNVNAVAEDLSVNVVTEDVNNGLDFKLYEKTPYEFAKANSDVYVFLKESARAMRDNPTDAESFLWKQMKGKALGVAFKRQCVILDYIADFFCPEHNLIIEVDGGYHELPEQMILDEGRTRRLEEKSYNILRFTNEDVLYNIDSVIQQIVNYIRL